MVDPEQLEQLIDEIRSWLGTVTNMSAVARLAQVNDSTLVGFRDGKHTPRLDTFTRLVRVKRAGPPTRPLW